MIRIVLTFGDSGLLQTLTSRGHAKRTAALPSEVCAAVSVLLRTAARLFSHSEGIDAFGSAEKEGHLKLVIEKVARRRREWFMGAVDLLILGLQDLEEEYPGSLQIRRRNVRKENGS